MALVDFYLKASRKNGAVEEYHHSPWRSKTNTDPGVDFGPLFESVVRIQKVYNALELGDILN